MSDKPTCYIEFRVTDLARFQVFTRFFEVLKNWSQQRRSGSTLLDDTQETRSVISNDDTLASKKVDNIENWMLVLRPVDLELLEMPAHAESIKTLQAWRGISKRERRERIGKDERLQILADFADMVKQFEDIQYELSACRHTYPDRARIEYTIESYPFVGKEALTEMLLFFGFFSILDDNC
jgi:hypothetical protein